MRWISMVVMAVVMVGCGAAGEEPARRAQPSEGEYLDEREFNYDCSSAADHEFGDGLAFNEARAEADARNRYAYDGDGIVSPDCMHEPGIGGLGDCEFDAAPDVAYVCEAEARQLTPCAWTVHMWADETQCHFDVVCVSEEKVQSGVVSGIYREPAGDRINDRDFEQVEYRCFTPDE